MLISEFIFETEKNIDDDSVEETIRQVTDGYRLYSRSGKNLGTYSTRAGAERRERQVRYFKHKDKK